MVGPRWATSSSHDPFFLFYLTGVRGGVRDLLHRLQKVGNLLERHGKSQRRVVGEGREEVRGEGNGLSGGIRRNRDIVGDGSGRGGLGGGIGEDEGGQREVLSDLSLARVNIRTKQ